MTEQNDLPFMYQNISECEFIRWNLDYTMPLVIDAASRISDNTIWKPVAPSFDPAGWILGSLPVHEDWTISFLKKRVFQLPERLKGFRSLPCAESPVIQEDLALLINSAVTTAELVQYWHDVRSRTHAYLMTLDPSDLKNVPDRASFAPDNHDPTREEFVKMIWMQNCAFGRLMTIGQLIAGKTRFPFPDWEATGIIWKKEMKKREPKGRWL